MWGSSGLLSARASRPSAVRAAGRHPAPYELVEKAGSHELTGDFGEGAPGGLGGVLMRSDAANLRVGCAQPERVRAPLVGVRVCVPAAGEKVEHVAAVDKPAPAGADKLQGGATPAGGSKEQQQS